MQIVRITIDLADTEVQRNPNPIVAPVGAGVIACVAKGSRDAGNRRDRDVANAIISFAR